MKPWQNPWINYRIGAGARMAVCLDYTVWKAGLREEMSLVPILLGLLVSERSIFWSISRLMVNIFASWKT